MSGEGEWAMRPGADAVPPGGRAGVETPGLRVAVSAEVPLVLQGLRTILERFEDVEVVGSAPSPEALAAMAAGAAPEILVVHSSHAAGRDMDRLAALHRAVPWARLVVLFGADATADMHALLESPADVLLPDDEVAKLGDILRALRPGCRYVTPRLIEHLQQDREEPLDGKNKLDCLTPREREILRRIVQGEGSRQIAAGLGIRPRTVDAHRASMMKKLNIHKMTGLVRLAVLHGLAQDA
jgi:two-component system nitrate/nitrite response regulator NarL